jgi:hypothetical protein
MLLWRRIARTSFVLAVMVALAVRTIILIKLSELSLSFSFYKHDP